MGMQELTAHLHRPTIAILLITDDRMLDIAHVHADLMGPARLQAAFHQRIACKALDHAKMRTRFLAVFFRDGHLLTVAFIAADRCVDHAVIMCERPMHERIVQAVHPLVGQLPAQFDMRQIVFGNDQQPGRIFVDAMHDARTQDPVDAGKILAVEQQRIDERIALIAVGRMHDHSSGLVDHDHIVVFITNVERNVLRFDIQLADILICDRDLLTAGQLVIALGRLSVDQHLFLRDQLLDAGAGQRGLLTEVFVDAHPFFRCFDGQLHL